MPLARMLFAGGDEEPLAVARERGVLDLPRAGRELLRLRGRVADVDGVQVHPAVALRQEPHALVVVQKRRARRAEPAAGLANPRIVVQHVDDAALSGLRIEQDVPAVLVVGRARARDGILAVTGDVGHRPADLALGLLPLRFAWLARLGNARGRRFVGRRRKTAVGPDRLAGLEVEHGEEDAALRVAHRRPTLDVFRVARLVDEAGDDVALGAGGTLRNQHEGVGAVGRQHRIHDGLPILQLDPGKLVGLLLRFGLFLLLLRVADGLEELLLFAADELLAVGQPRFGLLRGVVGQLPQARAAQIDQKQVAVAHVGDGGLVFRPARTALAGGRLREPAARAVLEDDHVAAVAEQQALVAVVPAAVGGRDVLFFGFAQLDGCATLPADHVGRRFVLAGLSPVEVELL